MASPASRFTKLATLQQCHMQISYKFHPGCTVNVECMDVNTFTLVSKVRLQYTDFNETQSRLCQIFSISY